MTTVDWRPDILGHEYQQQTIDLGNDPDGEGDINATLVRRSGPSNARGAIIYVHGFTDYFFQRDLADFYTARGFAFYALDLRKCGRSRQEGQTPHYVSDLSMYDRELTAALKIVDADTGGLPVVCMAHSTGGLILPLWLDKHRRQRHVANSPTHNVVGLVLNSPWFDLQGLAVGRSLGTQLLRLGAKVAPYRALPLPAGGAYGNSLHISAHGEWDYDLTLKPLLGCPITVGWLNAVRRGQARLHRGLEVGVPSLVLHSSKSHFARTWRPQVDEADAVLDVRQIAQWAGCLGGDVTSRPIDKARHDVFLSLEPARNQAYDVLGQWLDTRIDTLVLPQA